MTSLPVDAQAFFFVQGLVLIAVPITAWTILIGRHDATTVALWCTSGLMTGVGFVLVGLRGTIPDWLGYPVAMGLAFGAYAVRGAALFRELQRRPVWMSLSVVCILAVAGYEISNAWGRDMRELYAEGVRLLGAGWLAVLVFQLARQEKTRSAALLGWVYVLSAAASLARASAVLGHWGEGHLPTAADYALVNVAALLTALYANLGYVGVVLERSRARERMSAAQMVREDTQRVQAERNAERLDAIRAERREVLNEATPAMLHSIDVQGRLLAVSDTWLSKLGYARAEVIGRPSADFLTPASREYARQSILPAFFRTGRCDSVAYQMVRKDGSVLDVLLTGVLERDAHGQPLRSLAVIEDVSDKLARQAELEREQSQRLQAERHSRELDALLAERSEMLHVLAHEVRQPLNNASAVLQSTQTLLLQVGEQAVSVRLQRAQAVLGEVLAGLDNTLAVAALLAAGDVRWEDTDVDTLIGIALADMPVGERGRVRIERVSPTRTAAMDIGLMRLALRNLLANALAYSPPGSPVTVRVLDSDDPLGLVLEVDNLGSGIEPALVPRLFERGARGEHRGDRPGSGLGLYIVRRVMELHGGRAELAVNIVGLTTMRLTVPQQ